MKRHGLSMVAAGIPFAFASIRAASTRSDVRYFWVALASMLGAVATVMAVSAFGVRSASPLTVTAVFVVATLCAVEAALLIGTTFGLGVLAVGAGFGFWFAVAGWAYLRSRSAPRR